jgi:serine/threonine protein kinase
VIRVLQPGDVIGERYRVDSVIAKGGMGCVYLVKDAKLNNKIWVVKEITEMQNNEVFLEEAQMLTNLSHPNIPKITDYFKPDRDGNCYLVMEYIEGITLQRLFEKSMHKIPLEKTLIYMQQLCDILMYLHNQAKPIIFRDLKPSNIMVDEYDNIRLIDFGIARKFEQGKFADTVPMGTVAFAAPEQFEHKQTDSRTDIYAVGAILYYLLTEGKYYFQNTATLAHSLSQLPENLIYMVQKLVETNPDLRYQDIREVKEQLNLIQISLDPYELPSILPKTDGAIEGINGPLFIGIISAEDDVDAGNLTFLLAASLAKLGQLPLVIADGKPEIEAIERMVFKGEKEDAKAQVFENEGIAFMRQDVQWDFSELLASKYSHVLFWFEAMSKSGNRKNYVDWTKTQVPLLIANGARWKMDRLRERIDGLADSVRRRSKVLLYQAQPGILSEMEKDYPKIMFTEIPHCPDPFYPNQTMVQWASKLLSAQKKRRFRNGRLWFWIILALLFSATAIWVGLQIEVPKVEN